MSVDTVAIALVKRTSTAPGPAGIALEAHRTFGEALPQIVVEIANQAIGGRALPADSEPAILCHKMP